ncbi:DNA cytosine methyltransferase [Streptomyces sp. NPDC059411]|uniref:DNA cytosine methyltransferase n=1 Tax=Streptomyces sp. NPDC059411 TaxID=3346825 RepID=UPI0036C28D0D
MAKLEDPRTCLVLEPLRWALAAVDAGRSYESVVLEQVPAALPAWEVVGKVLLAEGYSVVHGLLNAEEFGVPQTRRRAVLIARRHGSPVLPKPTHRRYRKDASGAAGDLALPRWVSMGDVLNRDRPFVLVSNYGSGGDPAARGQRTSDQPACTVTGKIQRQRVMTADGIDLPRLTIAEAGCLQGFPVDYPWAGKGITQQIGNAVPPPLAEHILAAGLGLNRVPAPARTGAVGWPLGW